MKFARAVPTVLLMTGVLIFVAGCFQTNVPPVASFTTSPSSGAAPLSVAFDASASYDSDGTISTYQWAFGDGTTGNHETATHTYSTAGTRSVTLTVTDNGGAQGRDSHTIVVTSASQQPIQILDWQLRPYPNMFMPWVVTGHAKNVSGRALNYAEVDAQFYDANDILLSSWLDNITSLGPGVTWEFNVYCLDSDVAARVDHATVSVGTCY